MIRQGAPVPTASIHARDSSESNHRRARRADQQHGWNFRKDLDHRRAALELVGLALAQRLHPRCGERIECDGGEPLEQPAQRRGVLGICQRGDPRRAAPAAGRRCRTRWHPRSRTARPGRRRCARARARRWLPAAARGSRCGPQPRAPPRGSRPAQCGSPPWWLAGTGATSARSVRSSLRGSR